MSKYILEIWGPLPEKEWKTTMGFTVKAKVVDKKEFYILLDVWQYVLDKKIEQYTVYQAKCIIDNS